MRLGQLGSQIQPLIQPLQQLGSTETVNFTSLCGLFSELKDVTSEKFIEASTSIRTSGDQTPTVGQVLSSLKAIHSFMNAVSASAPKKQKITQAIKCLEGSNLATSFSVFSHEIKTVLIVDVVTVHLKALEEALGKPEFDAAYSSLERDTRVTRPKLAEIATRFVSQTAPSAAKAQTLRRIYARHASLIDSNNKREWQRGKSAA